MDDHHRDLLNKRMVTDTTRAVCLIAHGDGEAAMRVMADVADCVVGGGVPPDHPLYWHTMHNLAWVWLQVDGDPDVVWGRLDLAIDHMMALEDRPELSRDTRILAARMARKAARTGSDRASEREWTHRSDVTFPKVAFTNEVNECRDTLVWLSNQPRDGGSVPRLRATLARLELLEATYLACEFDLCTRHFQGALCGCMLYSALGSAHALLRGPSSAGVEGEEGMGRCTGYFQKAIACAETVPKGERGMRLWYCLAEANYGLAEVSAEMSASAEMGRRGLRAIQYFAAADRAVAVAAEKSGEGDPGPARLHTTILCSWALFVAKMDKEETVKMRQAASLYEKAARLGTENGIEDEVMFAIVNNLAFTLSKLEGREDARAAIQRKAVELAGRLSPDIRARIRAVGGRLNKRTIGTVLLEHE